MAKPGNRSSHDRRPAARRGARQNVKLALVGAVVLGMVLLQTAISLQGDEHASIWLLFAAKTYNFAVLVGLLIYFIRKPIGRFMRKSAAGAKQTLDDARKDAGEAETRLEEQRKNIASLKAELESLKADARAEAEAERDRLKSDADALAERLRQQSRLQIEQARDQAMATIRVELTGEAIRLAEEMIKDRMSDEHQRRLLDEHMHSLEAPP